MVGSQKPVLMRRRAAGALVLGAALLSAGASRAEDFNATVRPGQRALIGQFGTLNARTCYAGPVPTWKIGVQPANGTLQVVTEFATQNVDGCGQQRIAFARVYYTARPGFRGQDRAAVDFIYLPNSEAPRISNIRQNYMITVQ